tara:strand:+ start:3896 stop:5341 length:1446 start_codon:yes stop_codon:yes gene_type:complete
MARYKRIKNVRKRNDNVGPQKPVAIADIANKLNRDETAVSIEPAEVVDIMLNDTHEYWNADMPDPEEQIGMIKVRRVHSDRDIESVEELPWAVSLTRNIKQYPLKHEVVLVSTYISKQSQGNLDQDQLYYHDILNIWGSIHHNALPFISIASPEEDSANKDKIEAYKEIGFGNPNIAGDEEDIELGDTFKEQPRIRPVQPYEGDFTLEGRFGNSLRFGSAVKGEPANIWSDPSTDDPAEPILIIRNGQDQDLADGGEHIIEHPDKEAGSIWMTKGQTIPLTLGSTKYDALSFEAGANTVGEDLTAPTSDDLIDTEGERQGQILLTANRLIFNSREAGTYIFGGGGIGLTTETDLTLDAGSELLVDTPSVYLNATEKFELECPLIYLGVEQDSAEGGAPTVGSTKGHPLVLGDEDDTWKATLCDIIDAILTALQGELHPTPVGPTGPPLPPALTDYITAQTDIATLKASIPQQYSGTVFVQP